MSLIDKSKGVGESISKYYVYTAECGVQFAARNEENMVMWVKNHAKLCKKAKHALK